MTKFIVPITIQTEIKIEGLDDDIEEARRAAEIVALVLADHVKSAVPRPNQGIDMISAEIGYPEHQP